MNKGKYFLFSILFFMNTGGLRAQNLDPLCDSVLGAVQLGSAKKLRDLCPDYQSLKALYDTTDKDMMAYQIGIRQKELEYWTSRDMKNLNKYADREHISLSKLVRTEYHYEVQTNEEGYRYAYVQAKCVHRSQPYIVHFTLIELNKTWFYGEGLRMEKQVVVKEEVPNYDKIDRERERRQEEREKARLKAIEDQKKQEEALRKQREKEVKDSLKVVRQLIKEREREVKDSLKANARIIKQREKEVADSIKAEELKIKEADKEKRRIEKEEAKKKREKELEDARKQREEEKRRKEEEKEEREREMKKSTFARKDCISPDDIPRASADKSFQFSVGD